MQKNFLPILVLLPFWLCMACSADGGPTTKAPSSGDAYNGSFDPVSDPAAEDPNEGTFGVDDPADPAADPPPANDPPANDPPAEDPVCTPNCDGKACGQDGCGGTCGLCGDDSICIGGTCKANDDLAPAPDTGGCKNDPDLAILAAGTVSATTEECAKSNIGAIIANDPAPIRQCIKDATGLSEGCLDCFTPLMFCTISNCALQCMGGKTPECTTCLEGSCYPDFVECSGVNPANE